MDQNPFKSPEARLLPAKPKDVLNAADYSSYRAVRTLSVFFTFFGSIFLVAGIAVTIEIVLNAERQVHPVMAGVLILAGLTGTVGGIAALRGNRRWAPVVYVMAFLYLFMFPMGTPLGLAMLIGLPGYLKSMERIRELKHNMA